MVGPTFFFGQANQKMIKVERTTFFLSALHSFGCSVIKFFFSYGKKNLSRLRNFSYPKSGSNHFPESGETFFWLWKMAKFWFGIWKIPQPTHIFLFSMIALSKVLVVLTRNLVASTLIFLLAWPKNEGPPEQIAVWLSRVVSKLRKGWKHLQNLYECII